jgi:hypothetical protein
MSKKVTKPFGQKAKQTSRSHTILDESGTLSQSILAAAEAQREIERMKISCKMKPTRTERQRLQLSLATPVLMRWNAKKSI